MSKRSVFLSIFTLTAVLTVSFAASAQSADPWFGTWKLNLAKSTYSPGPPPRTATIRKVEPWEGGLKETGDGVNPEGQATHTEISAKFDGKDYPIKGAPAANTTRAYTRIDHHTTQFVVKVDGKVMTTLKLVFSPDGKTETATATGKNPQGQTVNTITVWDKQ
jgi:hypothetical protein